MRYIKFFGGTGYRGCDFEDYLCVSDDYLDSDLDSLAQELAEDNAESYKYIARGYEDEWESEEDRLSYYGDTYCDWEEITKEEYESEV